MEAVAVAIVSASGLIASTWLSTARAKRIETSLGRKNGEGSAIEILEHLKKWTIQHDFKHDVMEGRR